MRLIYGDRIALRRFEERMSDSEMTRLYRWSHDEDVLRWSGGSPTGLSESEFREHLRAERLYGPSNRKAYLILLREPIELIGRLGIFGIDWTKKEGELGIVIGERKYWGQGLGRDAVRTLIRHIYMTSTLNRIYLYTFVDNERAQRSFRSAGFHEVSRGRRFTPDIGEFDGIEMELTRADFERERAHKSAKV
jgi:RimJ/RimL family protein N-acetyltransferase